MTLLTWWRLVWLVKLLLIRLLILLLWLLVLEVWGKGRWKSWRQLRHERKIGRGLKAPEIEGTIR